MRTLVTLSLVLSLTACKPHDAPPAPAPSTPPQPAAVPQPAAADSTQGAPGSTNLAGLAALVPQLRHESESRPAAKVTAEHMFETLDKRGFEVTNRKQVLASTANASYCANGVTKQNVVVVICEYPTEKAAIAGREFLDKHYRKLVPDAVRKVNGNTLLTVANGASNKQVQNAVLDTFMSL